MKITTLLETPTTSVGTTDTQAPRFGRSDTVLEKEARKVEETSTGSGSVASVASPMGGMQRRGKGSMFAGIKTSAKFPNSKPVKEAESAGLSNRDKKDVEAIKAAIERLQAQLKHPNADKADIQQSIAHEKKRLELYGKDLAEDKGMTQYNAFKREWRAKHGSDAKVPSYDSKEYTSYVYRQNDKKQGVAEGQLDEFGGGGFPKTPNYNVGDSVMVKGYQGVGKIAYIKQRNDVGVIIKEPSPLRVVTTIDELIPKKGVAEGSENLSYIGNCTDDDVIEYIFGDATNFAQAVEEHGDEFTIDDLVVKYDPETDVHSFYYKQQGLTEGQVNEKSKSQAQFRTMAAVAHNPKFAKKVGISPKVGKEFHSADRKQNYKDLPKKVDEAELSEEQILAKKLQKHLDMFKKGLDHELGDRPKDNDIQQKVDEVSSELLSRYKKGASAQASQLDKEAFAGAPDAKQKIEKSNKRYSGIVRATKKQFDNDVKEDADPCWDNYRQLGMKKKNGKSVPNCVPKESVEENFDAEYDDEAGMFKNDLQTIQRVSDHLEDAIQDNENLPEWCQAKISQAKGMVVSVMDYMISQHENGIIDTIDEDWQKVNKKDKTDGMSSKAVKAYRRENPGSKLKTAVTTKPSKLKKGSKAANRRKSFCARMSGMKKAHASAKTKRDPDSPINKALRRWNCESVEQLQELMLLAEQLVIKKRKM